MIIKRTKIDFRKLQERFRATRAKIVQSQIIDASHKKILVFIYDNLLEGIRKERFNSYADITLFSVKYQYGILYLRIKFRLCVLVKSYKDIPNFDELLKEFEETAEDSGLSVKKLDKNELEVYLKGDH